MSHPTGDAPNAARGEHPLVEAVAKDYASRFGFEHKTLHGFRVVHTHDLEKGIAAAIQEYLRQHSEPVAIEQEVDEAALEALISEALSPTGQLVNPTPVANILKAIRRYLRPTTQAAGRDEGITELLAAARRVNDLRHADNATGDSFVPDRTDAAIDRLEAALAAVQQGGGHD